MEPQPPKVKTPNQEPRTPTLEPKHQTSNSKSQTPTLNFDLPPDRQASFTHRCQPRRSTPSTWPLYTANPPRAPQRICFGMALLGPLIFQAPSVAVLAFIWSASQKTVGIGALACPITAGFQTGWGGSQQGHRMRPFFFGVP